MTEKLTAWLKTFPLWQDERLDTDYVDALADSAGVYPQGIRELSRKTDVVGNVRVVNRLDMKLMRNCPQTRQENARWLLALQQWIAQQSALGLCPVLGDDPSQERIWAEEGKLAPARQTGLNRYGVNISAQYIRIY